MFNLYFKRIIYVSIYFNRQIITIRRINENILLKTYQLYFEFLT